jgi:hypothetical protein
MSLNKKTKWRIDEVFDYADIKEEAGEYYSDVVGDVSYISSLYTAEYKTNKTFIASVKRQAKQIFEYIFDGYGTYYDWHLGVYYFPDTGITRFGIKFLGMNLKAGMDLEQWSDELGADLTKWYDLAKLNVMYHDMHAEELDKEVATLLDGLLDEDIDPIEIRIKRREHKYKFLGILDEMETTDE